MTAGSPVTESASSRPGSLLELPLRSGRFAYLSLVGLPLLGLPLGGWALGLGDIELKSSLNQRLVAEVEVISATAEELDTLRVKVADRETFERYGLDRLGALSGVEFSVVRNEAGRPLIRVSSRETIKEPFVTMLLEVVWSQGRLLREYTVLVDPPVVLPEPPAPALVEVPRTSPPQRVPARAPPQPTSPAALAQPIVRSSPARPDTAQAYGPVQRGESLWSIASALRPDESVSMTQVMQAIFEANPQAFAGNMNLLYRDAVLRMPDIERIRSIDAATANAELARHETAWQASQSPRATDQEPRLVLRVADEAANEGRASVAAALDTAGSGVADVESLEQQAGALRAELQENRRLLQLKDAELERLQAQRGQQSVDTPFSGESDDAAAVARTPGVDLVSETLESGRADTTQQEQPQTLAARAAYVVTTTPREQTFAQRLWSWLSKPWPWVTLGVVLLAALAHRSWRG
jgi:pilus assembly protein FimV